MEDKRTSRTIEVNKISETLNSFATLKPTTKNSINNLNIMYTNADCFNNKKNDLELLLQTLTIKPDVIVITEINPKKMVVGLQESEFSLHGMFTLNVGKNKFRGIIIYVKINLTAIEIEINSNFSECLFIQLKSVSDNTLTIGAKPYRKCY